MPDATLVIFLGGFGESDAERLVDDARVAASIDAIDAWPGESIVVTDNAKLCIDRPRVTLDRDSGDYHFGRRLAGVVRAHGISACVYMGGGSVPLFGTAGFAAIEDRLASGAVTNNLYSSDFVAFPVSGEVLRVVETVDRDNSLARALKERAGLEVEALPRTVATQFDIDTPTDVCILAVTDARWAGRLAAHDLPLVRYRAVLPLFMDQTEELLVAGRVGTQAWQYLERETACRVRLFAEERGMEADGRVMSGAARSLLGYYLEAVGLDRFFETLGELGHAAFIDTRVLLAHKRIDASREDRFLSDLGRPQDIRDPFLRDFTAAAIAAPLPVLLGGHSLMAGGLMALNEYAWSERDAGRL